MCYNSYCNLSCITYMLIPYNFNIETIRISSPLNIICIYVLSLIFLSLILALFSDCFIKRGDILNYIVKTKKLCHT